MSSSFIFNPANLLVLPAMVVGNFTQADWQGAYRKAGALGMAAEFARAATGTNTHPFFIPTDAGWQFADVQALLLKHGIKVWAAGYLHNEMHFSVKKRQAHWAQYVLMRAGVPLLHGYLEGSRADPQAARGRPRAPGAKRERGLFGFLDRLVGAEEESDRADLPAAIPGQAGGFADEHKFRVVICDGSTSDNA